MNSKLFLIPAILAATLAAVSCRTDDDDGGSAVTGVTLDKTVCALVLGAEDGGGSTITLAATITPQDAGNRRVTWQSGNKSIAAVEGAGLSATVTALAAGSTTITCTTEDGGFTAECKVSVTEYVRTDLISKATALVYNGKVHFSWTADESCQAAAVYFSGEKIADGAQVSSSVYGAYSFAVVENPALAVDGQNFQIRPTFSDGTTAAQTVTAVKTGLPMIVIDTKDSAEIISKDDYVKMNITVWDGDHTDYSFSNSDFADGIRRRGNSTYYYAKKPYRIKFKEKTSLFGLEKAKSWVLLANYLDPTLIMNDTAFRLGQTVGLPFTNHGNSVDLILNGKYLGTYLLTEQIQVGSGRVDIDEDDGILAEFDTYYDEDPKFKTANYALPVMFKNPEVDGDDIDLLQDEVALLNALDAAVYHNGENDVADNLWELADVSTFAKFLLCNQIVKNSELAHPKSTYIYRDSDGAAKFCTGPLWDFDWAFGYCGSGRTYFVSGSESGDSGRCAFFAKLYSDETFKAEYKSVWNDYETEIAALADYMTKQKERLEKSSALNRAVWGFTEDTAKEIDTMTDWWNSRMTWMRTYVDSL